MKRKLAFFLVFCLIMGCCAAAFAASRPVITRQPEAKPGKNGTSLVITVKAHSFESLTWYFVNPDTGEKTSGRKISKVFKGMKVSNPNGSKMTLKNVPEELNGWSLYAHFYGNGYKVDSDMIVLSLDGPSTVSTASVPSDTQPAPVSAPASGPYTVSAVGLELYKVDASGEAVGDAASSLTFEGTAALCVKAPEGQVITNLLINALEFKPSAPVSSLTLNGINGTTVIKGSVANSDTGEVIDLSWDIGGADTETAAEDETGEEVQEEEPAEEPEEEAEEPAEEAEEETETTADTKSNTGKNTTNTSTTSNTKKTDKNASGSKKTTEDEVADEGGDFGDEGLEEVVTPAPRNTPEPEVADDESTVSVTCENCRFSGGGYTFATSGRVPAGTQIVVISGSSGDLAKGYVINGAAADYKGKSSFRITVDTDTSISMTSR